MQHSSFLNYIDKYIDLTEKDALLYGTSGTMAWEWFYSWFDAVEDYFPKYNAKNIVKGFFAINVPYPIPLIGGFSDTYKVFDNKAVLFKPLADWQHTDGKNRGIGGIDVKDNLSPEEFSDKINKLPKGTVTYVYMTHDAGARLEDINKLVLGLEDHV